jgi:hypothetical protein
MLVARFVLLAATVAALPLDKAEKLHKAKGISALVQYIQDNAKPADTKKVDLSNVSKQKLAALSAAEQRMAAAEAAVQAAKDKVAQANVTKHDVDLAAKAGGTSEKTFSIFMFSKACQEGTPGTPAATAGDFKGTKLGSWTGSPDECFGPAYCEAKDMHFYLTFEGDWTNELKYSVDSGCSMLLGSGASFQADGTCEAGMCPTGFDYSVIIV